jgi:hypothetical protein
MFHEKNQGMRSQVFRCYSNGEPLDAHMDNILASTLGKIALEVGDPSRHDVGDYIDRGLILCRRLREFGFEVREIPADKITLDQNQETLDPLPSNQKPAPSTQNEPTFAAWKAAIEQLAEDQGAEFMLFDDERMQQLYHDDKPPYEAFEILKDEIENECD